MIIDAHTHFTTAPAQLQAYRGQQITNLAKPCTLSCISATKIARSMAGQLKRMQDSGIDRLLFSPRPARWGIIRLAAGEPLLDRSVQRSDRAGGQLFPDKISPVCQLPQSPGVGPKEWVDELDRCVKDLGFVGCNVNPDLPAGASR